VVEGAVVPFWRRKLRRRAKRAHPPRGKRLPAQKANRPYPVFWTDRSRLKDPSLSAIWRANAGFLNPWVLRSRTVLKPGGFGAKYRAKCLGIVGILSRITYSDFVVPRRAQYLTKRLSKVRSFKELKAQGSYLFRLLTRKTRQWSVAPLRPATSFLKLSIGPDKGRSSLSKA